MYSEKDLFEAFKRGITVADAGAIDPQLSFKRWLKGYKKQPDKPGSDLGDNAFFASISKEFHKKIK